ncbi:uncharacterized protein LOC131522173 [Onychostoma macrolepis]|uniref:Uncharacterized protein n=1 Tax=Onychostoma macrolepis TaxID=369639 RepID=A0A7J6C8J5_9TELE|nr:uncharacterized protein LOC131522173 [Onychostoma macrolepis]KAF4103628.1 hypothetical protein G5714_016511 [Onychostoma macrolepis]
MALGEICCTIETSKTRRSLKTGFLFFLLLQMRDVSSSTTSEPVGPSSTTQSANTVSVSSSVSADQMTTSGSSVTGASSATVHHTASNSATVASTANTSSSENYTALSCPAFTCTKDCYDQMMNMTAKPCPSSEYICEIMKVDAGYSVSCSASCGVSCGNGSLTNCSVNCCNTTNCLNNILLAMFSSVSTTVATTQPTATTTAIKTTGPTTPANNGKKCHNAKCNGALCYKTSVVSAMLCPVGQDYCMLQKTTSGSTESWHAGCSTDCRKMPVCSSTTTACHLECCNATTTSSCLKLTGEVNMPSSATRGPDCPALLTASLLLFWIVKVFT